MPVGRNRTALLNPNRWMSQTRRWLATGTLVVSLGLANAYAVDAPTSAEWEPFEAAIANGDTSIRPRLTQFMTGRQWADGWVRLAQLDLLANDPTTAYRHATAGLDAALADGDRLGTSDQDHQVRALAASLAISSANQLGRPSDGLAAHARVAGLADPGGLAALAASESARLTGDLATADRLLKSGMQRAASTGTIAPDFFLQQARIFEDRAKASGDDAQSAIAMLEGAANSYERALNAGHEGSDIAFNLARLQRALAKRLPEERRREMLQRARGQAIEILTGAPNDGECATLLGLILLDLGADDARTNLAQAGSTYRSAYDAFATALSNLSADQQATRAVALRGRASARLKVIEADPETAANQNDVWSHRRAVEDLREAESIAGSSPDIANNLLTAYLGLQASANSDAERAGYQREIADLLAGGAQADPLNMALAQIELDVGAVDPALLAAAARDNRGAADLLAVTLGVSWADGAWSDQPDLPSEDTERQRVLATWRYLGHAERACAEIARRQGFRLSPEDADYEAAAAELNAVYEAAADRAAAAYLVAGNAADHLSRRYYVAIEAQRGGERAYAAAQRQLGWSSYLSLTGWKLSIAHYGSSGAWKSPIHLAIWGVLIGIPLLLGLKGIIIGKPVEAREPSPRARGDAPPSSKQQRPPGTGQQRRPGTARQQRPPTAQQKRPSDETLKPNTEIKPPIRDDALERRPRPKPDNRQNQQAIDDVAKRLAQQHRDRQDGGTSGGGTRRPPSRRRR